MSEQISIDGLSLPEKIAEIIDTSSTGRIIYSRGFPYGAPLVMIRGGATNRADVREFLKNEGFRWGGRFAWEHYLNRREFGAILKTLRDRFGCSVEPKDTMDASYQIDLDDENFNRPESAPVLGTGKTKRRKDSKRARTSRKRQA